MSEIQRSILKAIEHIESNLDRNMPLSEIAKEACYSSYHFQRIFSGITGLSLAAYIRRRRLTRASHELLATRRTIIDIALEAGFESQESFTRAFKKMYLKSPGAFRKSGTLNRMKDQSPLDARSFFRAKGVYSMEPKYMEVEDFYVIGITQTFKMSEPNTIPALWDKFITRYHEIKVKSDRETYGICYSKLENGKPSDTFQYTASVPVEKDAKVPPGMVKIHILKQKYAVFTHKGPISKLGETVNYIWGKWVMESGCKLVDAPDFEKYDERFDPGTMSGELDIYVPIMP